jgi:hypothetical protein
MTTRETLLTFACAVCAAITIGQALLIWQLVEARRRDAELMVKMYNWSQGVMPILKECKGVFERHPEEQHELNE